MFEPTNRNHTPLGSRRDSTPVLTCHSLVNAMRDSFLILGVILLALCPVLLPESVEAQDGARPAFEIRDSVELNPKVKSGPIRRRWAFLVGIDRYNHLRDLNYCAADMRSLRDALIEHGGYDPDCVATVTYSEDSRLSVSSGLIRVELMNFLGKVHSDDSVLFAFAGHGDVDELGKAWLMMPEASVSKEKSKLYKYTALPVEEIYSFLEGCNAQQKMIVLDACHSGASRGDEEDAANKLSLFDITPGKGILELLSCDGDQVSFESKELGQGVFSHFLSKGIAGDADTSGDQDGFVSADELYNYAYMQTKDYVWETQSKQQTPKRRSDAVGQIIVAVRKTRDPELSAQQITEKLKQVESQAMLPVGFTTEAQQWLTCAESYPPGTDLKTLLSLLARDAITKQEFDRLALIPLIQVKQHLQAAKKFDARKTFVVAIGINEYQDESLLSLENSEADASVVSDIMRVYGGESLSSVVLVSKDCTRNRVQREIAGACNAAGKGDLIIVFYSGHGRGGHGFDSNGAIKVDPTSTGKGFETSITAEIQKHSWLLADTRLEHAKGANTVGYSAEELLSQISSSSADFLIVSDSSGFDLPLPSLFHGSGNDHSVVAEDRAVIFVGLENGWEVRQASSQLTLLLSRCISGSADSGLQPIPNLLSTNSAVFHGRRELATVARDSNSLSRLQTSDGFVSLQEIASVLEYYQIQSQDYFGFELRVRGYLPADERFVTRVTKYEN